MFSLIKIKKKSLKFFERHGVVLAGIVIFLYYLWAAIDLFSSPYPRRGFGGYFLQFSSVVMLWGLIFLGAKLFEFKNRQRAEQEKSLFILQEYERRKMQLELLDEVSVVLSDTVNNPLAVISLSASSLRSRLEPNSEVLLYLDKIEVATKRVREVLTEFKSYKTTKIVKSIQDLPSRQPSSEKEKLLTVDQEGEIRSE